LITTKPRDLGPWAFSLKLSDVHANPARAYPPEPMPDPRDTPAMRQYYRFKRLHPGCVLLFRIGDFYEMFDDDAVTVSRALGLTLTQRTEGVPMAGMPYHQLEVYLKRLIDQGFRVAVAEQMQDPKEAKAAGGSVIERSVTRVLTPGTLVDDTLLADDRSSAIAAACFLDSGDAPEARVAVAIAELSTGDFLVLECAAVALVDELARRSVTELVYADTADGNRPPRIARVLDALNIAGTPQASWHFRSDEARESLHELFGVTTLAGFGIADDDPVIAPAGALVRYFRQTQTPDLVDKDAPPSLAAARNSRKSRLPSLKHLRPPRREAPSGFCMIDATTLRSLEILRTIRGERAKAADIGAGDGSLVSVFSSGTGSGGGGCRTAMGKRLLRDWLCRPSCDLGVIRARHRAVATLIEDRRTADALSIAIDKVQDVARIGARIALGRCTPRDLVALGVSLAQAAPIVAALDNAPALAGPVKIIDAARAQLEPLAVEITRLCVDSPPAHLREGGLIRDAVDAALDEARLLQRDAGTWLADYQKSLLADHNLPGLKVGYNKVFGYYIELTKSQAKAAPASFVRKQTLTGGTERFITPELKQFEDKVTHAQARALEREQELFNVLCETCARQIHAATRFAEAVAELDVLLCFASTAVRRRWVEPAMVEEPVLQIEQGRHPVLDELLGSNFVPNDLDLGGEGPSGGGAATLALITGPNMAGKSTFIRQTALIVLLAHAGSFVPADRAVLGVTDRVFTRIGADDALHAGQSTFMVEMTETARILHHATRRSLVVLDEIGRGTSTLDGLSLAWAIAEHFALGGGGGATTGPRALFATHYHELTELEDRHPDRIRNLHVAVREWGDQIVFLHRILPGRTDQSYGIHVAKLAGIPDATITRAREILESVAVQHHIDGGTSNGSAARPSSPPPPASREGQMFLFTEFMPHPAMTELKQLKLDALSPMQAFDELRKLKQMLDEPRK
jgi:DNA mismatch repair protein MutS